MAPPAKPVPHPTAETEPFWAGTRAGKLMMPRCEACGAFHFYPRQLCPACGSDRLAWAETGGRGTVYSFTIVHRPPNPAFEADVPYAVGIVALDEGPHMMTRITGVAPDAVRIGMPVRVRFEPAGEETALPIFEVAS